MTTGQAVAALLAASMLAMVAACQSGGASQSAFTPSTYSPPPSVLDEPTDLTAIQIEDDPYEARVMFASDTFKAGAVGDHGYLWILAAAVDRTNGRITTVIVRVADVYSDEHWAFWDRATGPGGRLYQVVSVHREVRSCDSYNSRCTYSEQFNVILDGGLPPPGEGVDFKIHGDRGLEQVIRIPAVTVDAIRDAVSAWSASG